MITKSDGKIKLLVFENFQTDFNLPKHVQKTYNNNNTFLINTGGGLISTGSNATGFESISMQNVIPVMPSVAISDDVDRLSLREQIIYCNDLGERWKIRFRYYKKQIINLFKKKKGPNFQALIDFFNRIPFDNLSQSAEVIKYYEDAMLHVKKTGQVALEEKLKNILMIVRHELKLIDKNITKYVTEENITSLYEKVNVDKKLKLTWIKNFVKIIPTEVLKLKEDADNLEIFDNYVILHYDPNNDATNLTQAEVLAKKDPILFGVIRESNKLYYIADWIDEYCDLTLEKMFETLGDKVLEINNESVKSFINSQKS